MRGAAVLVFFGALLNGAADVGQIDPELDLKEDYVFTFEKDGFDRELSYKERALVNFYKSDGCVPCTDFAPVFSKAARLVKAEIDLNSVLVKVDVSENPDLVERHKLKGDFPLLKYYMNGQLVKDYDGKVDAENIALWVKNREDPPVKEVKEDALDAFVEKTEDESFALVAHVKKNSVRAKTFIKAVEDTLREWDVAQISFAAVYLPKDADPKADAKLTLHRPGIKEPDEEQVEFTGSWSEDKIVRWVQKNCYATIGQTFTRNKYAPMSMEEIGMMGAIVAVVNDADEMEDEEDKKKDDDEGGLRPQVEEALLPLTSEYPNWKFVIAELSKLEEHENVLLGVNPDEAVRLIVLGVDKKKYHLLGEDNITTTKRIRRFLKDAMGNKLKPFLKSEPDPEPGKEYDEDGVLVLTGYNFEKHISDSKKDFFVKFYAPWCKHSQALEPKWAEMAKKGAKDGWKKNNVVIAKFDAGSNECAEEVAGFPKLVLYPAVKASKKFSEKMEYTGSRETAALYEFVTESARNLQDGGLDGDDDDEEEERPKKKKRKQQKKGKAEEL